MELVGGERILWQGRPSWRSQISFFMLWIPIALLPVIIAGVLRANDKGTGLPYWQWLLISLLLVILVVVYDVVRRYATLYVVTNQRLRVRTGILSRDEQTARFDRIQNVNIAQSLADRLLKVGLVDFDTAGSGEDQASFRFRGIADPQRLVRIVAENVRHDEERAPGGL
ncbi:MAG: PH domain-containing protein [Thermoleophilia bacterium]